MNNMTLSVLPIGNGVVTTEKMSLILSEKLPNNVRPGMLLALSELPDLSLLNNKNLLELNLVLPNGKKFQVMAKPTLPINVGDITKSDLALRVTQDGNLQFVTVKGEALNITDKVFSYTSCVPEVVSYPTKLMPMLEKVMEEEGVSTDIKKWVGEVMADAEVVAKLKGFEGNVENNNILDQIKQTLRNLKNSLPEQNEVLKQQFVKDVENLVGKSFEAKFYYEEGNVKFSALETPLGKILAESLPNFTKDEIIQMEVLKVSLGNKPELLRIINDFGKYLTAVLPDGNKHLNSLIGLLQNPNNEPNFLVKILSPLLGQIDGEKYATDLLQNIPGLKTNILSNIYNYYRSTQSGSAKEWLGNNLYDELRGGGEW